MALFGLSPLFLSVLASEFFADATSGLLDIVPFLKFMAGLTASTHVLGYFTLQTPSVLYVEVPVADRPVCDNINESSALLPREMLRRRDQAGDLLVKLPHPIQDWYFWLLWLYSFMVIGAVSVFKKCGCSLGNVFHRPKW